MDERPPETQRTSPDRRDVAGMVGWGLLIALAVGLLVMRMLGGGC